MTQHLELTVTWERKVEGVCGKEGGLLYLSSLLSLIHRLSLSEMLMR